LNLLPHPPYPKSWRPYRIKATVKLGIVLTMVLVAGTVALPGTIVLHCSTKKVVITSGPQGETSLQEKEELVFQINDAAKRVTLKNSALAIRRFDRTRITAEQRGIIYDLDRQNHTVSYAGSTTSGAAITTIVGSGACR
jgi:hypothetical protein